LPWQLTHFQAPQSDFIIFGDFIFEKHLKRSQTQPNIFICLLDHVDEGAVANIKTEHQRWPTKLLISGWSESQYVAMVTKF